MTMRRSTRNRLCGWLGALLLFVQVAAMAYACPTGLGPDDAAALSTAVSECDGHQAEHDPAGQTLLCKTHCQQGTETLQPSASGNPVLAPSLLAVMDWRPPIQLLTACAAPGTRLDAGAAPPGTPPIYLSLRVLRN